jgi:hypothetical protein
MKAALSAGSSLIEGVLTQRKESETEAILVSMNRVSPLLTSDRGCGLDDRGVRNLPFSMLPRHAGSVAYPAAYAIDTGG